MLHVGAGLQLVGRCSRACLLPTACNRRASPSRSRSLLALVTLAHARCSHSSLALAARARRSRPPAARAHRALPSHHGHHTSARPSPTSPHAPSPHTPTILTPHNPCTPTMTWRVAHKDLTLTVGSRRPHATAGVASPQRRVVAHNDLGSGPQGPDSDRRIKTSPCHRRGRRLRRGG